MCVSGKQLTCGGEAILEQHDLRVVGQFGVARPESSKGVDVASLWSPRPSNTQGVLHKIARVSQNVPLSISAIA
jgi:hypothetical protein